MRAPRKARRQRQPCRVASRAFWTEYGVLCRHRCTLRKWSARGDLAPESVSSQDSTAPADRLSRRARMNAPYLSQARRVRSWTRFKSVVAGAHPQGLLPAGTARGRRHRTDLVEDTEHGVYGGKETTRCHRLSCPSPNCSTEYGALSVRSTPGALRTSYLVQKMHRGSLQSPITTTESFPGNGASAPLPRKRVDITGPKHSPVDAAAEVPEIRAGDGTEAPQEKTRSASARRWRGDQPRRGNRRPGAGCRRKDGARGFDQTSTPRFAGARQIKSQGAAGA